jgi:glutaredoxin
MTTLGKIVLSTLLIGSVAAAAGWSSAGGSREPIPVTPANDEPTLPASDTETLILLGADWCGHCQKTRDYLQSRGIVFTDLDIENSELARRWHRQLGGKDVPVILIGNRQIRGFNVSALDAAIAAMGPELLVAGSR